ncbi:MAG TPA: endo-1,4-beta-xylanase [Chloroflexia bacterium]|nr:endo-1,4-beta-xylanase [Chloroflexia bacterium]
MKFAIRNSQFAIAFIFLVVTLLVLLAGFLPRFPQAAAPVALVPTPTPLLFRPENTKIGLHTRLTDEPEPGDIEREFRMLREMGGTWATEFFPWTYIQPSDRNRFDWTHADLVVDAAQAAGVTLLARVDGVPSWARPEGTTWRYLDQKHYQDYGDFIHAFVSRYKGRVSHYIIWNEPNTSAEWGQRPPDPQGYAELLQVAYRRAKEADPDCIVLLAGLAPNLEREGSPNAMNDLTYLERLYDAGAARYFDAVAVHSYGLTSSPDEPADPRKINFARAEEIRRIMVERGDGEKPVFITEGGWNDSPRWSYAVKPYQRVEYTVDAYRKAEEEWPWCKAVCLWASRLPSPAYTYFDNYTFLTPDFIPKAVYLEVQKYALGQVRGVRGQGSGVRFNERLSWPPGSDGP